MDPSEFFSLRSVTPKQKHSISVIGTHYMLRCYCLLMDIKRKLNYHIPRGRNPGKHNSILVPNFQAAFLLKKGHH